MGVPRRPHGRRAGVPKTDARGSVERVQRKRYPYFGLRSDHIEHASGCGSWQRSGFTPTHPPAPRLRSQRVSTHYFGQESFDREGESIACGILARGRSGNQTPTGPVAMRTPAAASSYWLRLAGVGWRWLALAGVARFFTQKSHVALGQPRKTLIQYDWWRPSGIFDSHLPLPWLTNGCWRPRSGGRHPVHATPAGRKHADVVRDSAAVKQGRN